MMMMIKDLRNSNDRGTQTHRQHGDLISLLLVFQNRESRLKMQMFLFFFFCRI
jgi:hypothetical protein